MYIVASKSVLPPKSSYFTGEVEKNSKNVKKHYTTGNGKTAKDFVFTPLLRHSPVSCEA